MKLDEDDHIVLLTMHHVISDAWSTNVLIREVATLYGAFVRGEASPLAELPIQYADFAVWQREWLRGEVLERQLAYWREQLKGAPPCPGLSYRPIRVLPYRLIVVRFTSSHFPTS